MHDAAPIGQREVGGASALFVVLVALPFVFCFVALLCVMPRGGIGSIRLKAKEAPRRIRSKLNFKVINSMP